MADVTPIADLSYRGYAGELKSPRFRWWVIARMSIRIALKKRVFWVMTVLSGWYYMVMMTVLFFMEQFSQNTVHDDSGFKMFISRINWNSQFFHGFSYGQIWYFIIALILGAGCIANDNKANALLSYLSKPCTKVDYIVGKWVGVFLPLVGTMLIPGLFFFAYGALSWRSYGFLSQDHWVLPKFLLAVPIAAAVQASLVVGMSSLFRQGQQAGAAYAALFFVTNFFTLIMTMAWTMGSMAHEKGASMMGSAPLTYASVDGVQIAIAKAIMLPTNTIPFGSPSPPQFHAIPPPHVLVIVPIALLISALMVLLAWKRIQAVEVVR